MTRRFTYREIPAWWVETERRHKAEVTLRLATVHLKVRESCVLRWFLDERDVPNPTPLPGFKTTFTSNQLDLFGCVMANSPTSVWLRADLPLHKVTETVAHEVEHVRQYQAGSVGDADQEELDEIRACIFAGRFTAVLSGD